MATLAVQSQSNAMKDLSVKAPAVSVVIPVYNEKDSLRALKDAVRNVTEQTPEIGVLQIIFVDDGSTDGSWPLIAEMAGEDPNITSIRLRRNFGKAAALDVGVREATTDIIITMDADLQDDPSEIPNFLSKLNEGYDVVSGWKEVRKDKADKVLPSKLFNYVTARLTGVKLKDMNCGFKAYRREVFDTIALYGELHRYIPVLADSIGYRVGEIPVKHHARKFGVSKYGFKRYTRGFIDLLTTLMITRFDRRPGHLFGGVGLLLSVVGVAFLTYLSIIKIAFGASIGERPLLMLGVLLVIVGGQLLLFGMMSELIINRTEPPTQRGIVAEMVGRTGAAERV
jgi:glycosyltransferase involved in cell wall biosynthesis